MRAFLKDARDKVVKVIAHLLPNLPYKYRYRIIFMERDIYEVIGSQQKMLVRDGKRVQADALPLNLVKEYEQTLDKVKQWAEKHPSVEILYVKYRDVIENPFMQAMFINDFLDEHLSLEQMAAAVDAKLYREKI